MGGSNCFSSAPMVRSGRCRRAAQAMDGRRCVFSMGHHQRRLLDGDQIPGAGLNFNGDMSAFVVGQDGNVWQITQISPGVRGAGWLRIDFSEEGRMCKSRGPIHPATGESDFVIESSNALISPDWQRSAIHLWECVDSVLHVPFVGYVQGKAPKVQINCLNSISAKRRGR